MINFELLLFLIFIMVYLFILGGMLYLSYTYIKYINDLEKKGCDCSKDIKRDMIKNFSYLILGSWVLLLISLIFTPSQKLIKFLDIKIVKVLNFIIVGGYGFLLFMYSKKLIEESCKCSENWVRDAMQYQSYIYIAISFISFIVFLIRLLLGNDQKEIFKLINAYRNNKI